MTNDLRDYLVMCDVVLTPCGYSNNNDSSIIIKYNNTMGIADDDLQHPHKNKIKCKTNIEKKEKDIDVKMFTSCGFAYGQQDQF